MTIWEHFLPHRWRYARRMTFAIGLREHSVAEESFVTTAIVEPVHIVTAKPCGTGKSTTERSGHGSLSNSHAGSTHFDGADIHCGIR